MTPILYLHFTLLLEIIKICGTIQSTQAVEDAMAVTVDIADRLYDYTDEEKAAEAVVDFQLETGLSDQAVVDLWTIEQDPRRLELERRIFAAVDANGSAKRARETIPGGITLSIEKEAA